MAPAARTSPGRFFSSPAPEEFTFGFFGIGYADSHSGSVVEKSLRELPVRNPIRGCGLSGWSKFDILQSQLGGFSRAMNDLLFAVLGVIELGFLVCIFHSVAQHAVGDTGEFDGHGLGRYRRPLPGCASGGTAPLNSSRSSVKYWPPSVRQWWLGGRWACDLSQKP
jgi:hypothetical protein